MATENNLVVLQNNKDPDHPLTLVTIHNSIKLTSTNYLSWKTQIESILIGYDLYKFIDGSYPSPPATITTNDTVSANPAYQTWLRQDKLLFGALVGTISINLVPLITHSTTSHDAWLTLANTYARPSRGYRNDTAGNRHKLDVIILIFDFSVLRRYYIMAVLLSRARNIAQLLKAKITSLEKMESMLSISRFHADSCYKSMAGECRRKSPDFRDKPPGFLTFRRYESARAGGQVEPVPDTDNEDEENQVTSA
ncbi:hypothetical protein F511_05001 [Dorcoceras hygrometricum]|uniref:Retrotransposon Copia-like N-terminal domain-containing protein n=1 Tax=Dorcoceras hygrometricum TaxID=472368 RepID=A0A2Z7AVA9_9LAMI|nr:hypothetical protein F511_05001 [Dorcoceras hygrometricum]